MHWPLCSFNFLICLTAFCVTNQFNQKQPLVSKEIIIGSDVGIGSGCLILPGVSIGNGSLVAAGSIIHKSVPENKMRGGTPLRFYRKPA